jgi:hypothetical protein
MAVVGILPALRHNLNEILKHFVQRSIQIVQNLVNAVDAAKLFGAFL